MRRNITRSFKKLHYPTEVTEVAEIKDDLYVDKMIARGDIWVSHISDRDGSRTFHQAGFKLQKWNSNISPLEENDNDQTYARQ